MRWPWRKAPPAAPRLIVWAIPDPLGAVMFAAEHKRNGHVRATVADAFGTETVLFDSEQLEAAHGDDG